MAPRFLLYTGLRFSVCTELLEDLLLHIELVTSEFILVELRRRPIPACRERRLSGWLTLIHGASRPSPMLLLGRHLTRT